MNECTPTTEEVRIVYIGTREEFAKPWQAGRAAEFDRWLAAHDAEVRAEAQGDPAKDERLVRYMAMATPLGYQSALTVVDQMTRLIEAENRAKGLT